MSPLVSVKIQIAEVRDYIATLVPDSLPHRIAVAQLRSLNKAFSSLSSQIPPAQPMAKAVPTPIKSSMGRISNMGVPEKPEKWDWNDLNEKQNRQIEKLQAEIVRLFFTKAERHVLKFILLNGGLKKCLSQTSLAALETIPSFVRKAQGAVLLKTFEESLLK